MADVFDITLDADFDLMIKDGDFVNAESTKQHQECLLIAGPGDYEQNPLLGAAVFTFINDDEPVENIKKAIQKTFEADGMKISHLSINGSKNIDITASY